MDENLTWKNQIKSITERAFHASGFLKFAKHFLPEAVVKLFILASLSLISNTAALFGAVAIPLTSYNCRGSKIEQQAL